MKINKTNSDIYNSNFVDIKLDPSTMYIYTVRRAIFKAIKSCLSLFSGVILDLGCGEMPYRRYILKNNKMVTKYIGIDVNFNPQHQITPPDLYWDGKKIPLKNKSINTVFCTELFEHIPDIETVLFEIKRVLKKDGLIFFTVPFIWPLHEVPFDEYRYTPYSLTRHLSNSGFNNIQVFPLGDYDTALAQILGIWMCHRPVNFKHRIFNIVYIKIERILLFYVIKKLTNRAEMRNITTYGENTIPIGFYGYAYT